MPQYQLRIYTIRPGLMDEFVAGWREHILPLRLAARFHLEGVWTDADSREFVWMLSYAGQEGYAAADAAYYASPTRAGITWDPLPYIETMKLRLLEPVSGESAAAARSPSPAAAA